MADITVLVTDKEGQRRIVNVGEAQTLTLDEGEEFTILGGRHGGVDEGPQPPEDGPGLWVVLRDPTQAKVSSWDNRVTRGYDSRAAAIIEAERLCRETGFRFLVMRADGYVEPGVPTPPAFHWGAPADPLADLPF